MNKAMRKSVFVILVLFIALVQWPMGEAITPQDQTISITDTHDDRFITEAGVGIDAWLCHILDPEMDIRSYLVFRNVSVNYWEPLENATLRLRTTVNLDFDADSSVTIYGIDFSNLQDEGWLTPGNVLMMPPTSAYVNVNTSQFYGQQWHEIDVTNIVEELIRDYGWDGDGHDGTETGDAIGFIILGDEGQGTRWFIDYHYGTPSLASQLVIHWNHEPPPPAGAPTADFNETYRGYDIWSLEPDSDENRTGQGADVNWNILNMTGLTEQDSGADITLHNDTWATVSSMSKSATASIYNDTGYANIETYFLRFKVNMTNVNNAIAGNDPIPSFYGLSTASPGTSVGLAYGATGEWVGLVCIVLVDDESWRVWIHERVGVVDDLQAFSTVFNENNNKMTYWEVFTNMTGPNPYTRWAWYNDPEYSDLNETKTHIHAIASGPFRYPQTLASMGQAGASTDSFEYYTFNETQISLGDPSWWVTDENGTTIADNLDDYDDAIIVIEDILGADPEDPDPPGEEWFEGPGGETGAFTRFRMRLWFMLIGFGCLFGPLLFFAWRRPSGYYILCGAIVMLIGVGMLLSIGQV